MGRRALAVETGTERREDLGRVSHEIAVDFGVVHDHQASSVRFERGSDILSAKAQSGRDARRQSSSRLDQLTAHETFGDSH